MSKTVIREAHDSLWHARSHKYIDKVWKDGRWVYIYGDPNQVGEAQAPVQTGTGKKKKGRRRATKTDNSQERKDRMLRDIVTRVGSGFGDKVIDRAKYVRKDREGRRYYWTRNKEGRMVKKYMDEEKKNKK